MCLIRLFKYKFWMLYFCSSDNLLSAPWLRLFDGFQNVSGKILYFVFRPKTLLFSDVRCFCFSAEITNVARYPAGRSPRCSKPWPGWILGRVRTKQSADFSVVSVLQQFHWRMRRSDVTFVQARRRENPDSETSETFREAFRDLVF